LSSFCHFLIDRIELRVYTRLARDRKRENCFLEEHLDGKYEQAEHAAPRIHFSRDDDSHERDGSSRGISGHNPDHNPGHNLIHDDTR
jgi:hypothetical protein